MDLQQKVEELDARLRAAEDQLEILRLLSRYGPLVEDGQWRLWRAAINHWVLERTAGGWRIAERFNRVLDGSPESHATIRKVLA
jgi:hypothetical protein